MCIVGGRYLLMNQPASVKLVLPNIPLKLTVGTLATCLYSSPPEPTEMWIDCGMDLSVSPGTQEFVRLVKREAGVPSQLGQLCRRRCSRRS